MRRVYRTTTCATLLFLCWLVAPVEATLAFDAVSAGAVQKPTVSWTHTPVGTPRAVIVLIAQDGASGADEVTSVTYGGVTMSEVSGSPNSLATGENGAMYCYFLGSSIPTGAQTVTVNVTGTGGTKWPVAITLTGAADTVVQSSDGTIHSTSLANPSVTLTSGGNSVFAAIGFFGGQNAPTSNTPLSGWTDRGENDFGTTTGGVYTFDTVGTSNVTAGYTAAAEDAVMMAVAIAESGGGGAPACQPTLGLLGVSRCGP